MAKSKQEVYGYRNQFNRDNYARLSINVRKEERESIDAHWRARGYKSFNAYVLDLIQNDMQKGNTISVGNVTQNGNGNSINIG